jgi:hypothetical protein
MAIKHSAVRDSLRRSNALPIVQHRSPHKKDIRKIAGCMSTKDAEELKTIIEHGCERIDPDAWKNLH